MMSDSGVSVTFPDGSTAMVPHENLQSALSQGGGKVSQQMSFPDGSQAWVPVDRLHEAITQGQGKLVNVSPRLAGGDTLSGDSNFKPDNQEQGGGFVQHLWNNLNPANMVDGVRQMLSRPVDTYLKDESARAADLKNAGDRAGKIIHGDASIGRKALGLVDTAAQGAADFVPFLGTQANHAADELGQGHVGSALGDATGLAAQMAAPDFVKAAPDLASAASDAAGIATDAAGKVATGAKNAVVNTAQRAKNAVSVPPPVQALADGRIPARINPSDVDIANGGSGGNPSVYIDQQTIGAQPTPEDAAAATRKVAEIQQKHRNVLQQKIGTEIDGAAGEIGADTSAQQSIGDKAKAAGDAYKGAGQAVYKQLDGIAKEATGSDRAFQKIGEDIASLKEKIDDPALSSEERTQYTAGLEEALARQSAFVDAAEKAGIPNVRKAVAEANRKYSVGLSIQEVGRRFNLQENADTLSGGANNPLANPLRAISEPIQPRGHVLAQAFGPERAARIQKAVADAGKNIAADRVAADAAKQRVQATARTASDAESRVAQAQKTSERNIVDQHREHETNVKLAQRRVDQVTRNRRAAIGGGLGLLGLGTAKALYGGASKAHDALSGK